MDSVKLGRPGNRAVGLFALAAALSPAALAQQAPNPLPPPGPSSQAAVQSFDAVFFKQYNPITAADIVNRVPGFEIDDGEALRGFAATAGNVLVNGERPSSKVLVSEQLKRIPADSVLKVELISGSSSNVDVRGQTQLVNVVLKQAKPGGSPTTFAVEARDIQYSERASWNLQLTKTFALGENAELTVDFQLPNLRGRTESYEAVRNPAGTLTAYRKQFGQPNNIGVQGSGVLKWKPTAQDTVNFNAQAAPTWNNTNIGSISYTPAGGLTQATFGVSDYTNNYTAEVGADWEHRFAPEFSVKGIALATFTGVDQDDLYQILNMSGLINTQTIARTTEGGERVGRGFATWRPNAAHTIDFGVEGAFNFRETTFDIFNNNGSGPVAQPLPVSDTRVEETRIEPFITDVWKISPQLTLETGFVYEASKIKQSGDEVKEREFSYPKPRLIATWQVAEGDQVRGSISREVAQLDFAEFASSINVVDASSLIGNPDLEPEKTWRAKAEWEHKFGKRGAITLAVFHDQVTDVQDFVPRTVVLGTFDAPGNIGDGTRTGIEVRGALPLSPLIPNAELRFSGMYQETEVTDPQTGEDRRFSSERDWTYNVAYRQELPELKAAWGASAAGLSDRLEYKYLEQIAFDRPTTRFDVFVETTQFFGVTIRGTFANMFHPEETRIRTFYTGSRASGLIARTEERKQKGGPDGTQVITLRVSGTF
jgi:outer membrane receptor protein involved in Fe transport